MRKAILAFMVTVVVGVLVDMVGVQINVQLGSVAAIAVMGAFIIYFNEQKK